MNDKSIIFQPYYNWNGHFKKYTDSLLSEGDLKLTLNCNKEYSNFLSYVWLRFFLYFKLLLTLRSKLLISNYNKVFFVDFEPVSICLFLGLIKKIPTSVFTIHSVKECDYGSFFKNTISKLQRCMFNFSVKKLSKLKGVCFVVHSDLHKTQLSDIIGSDQYIYVVDYPSPEPNFIDLDNDSSKVSLLVFGAMRRDKQLYSFLKELKQHKETDLEFIFLGKVFDERIASTINNMPDFIKIIDKFVSEAELTDYVRKAHFFLLPYGTSYTGGAGPLKDAASYGRPVIASNIPFFVEQSKVNNFTIIYKSIDDIERIVNIINSDRYSKLTDEAKSYSMVNNWSSLRVNYNGFL